MIEAFRDLLLLTVAAGPLLARQHGPEMPDRLGHAMDEGLEMIEADPDTTLIVGNDLP